MLKTKAKSEMINKWGPFFPRKGDTILEKGEACTCRFYLDGQDYSQREDIQPVPLTHPAAKEVMNSTRFLAKRSALDVHKVDLKDFADPESTPITDRVWINLNIAGSFFYIEYLHQLELALDLLEYAGYSEPPF